MKVIINKCWGGFGISNEALKELVKRNAKCIESFKPITYYGGDNEKFNRKNDWEQKWKEDFAGFIDIGEGFKAHKYYDTIYKDGLLYSLISNNEVRTDKDLIEVVHQLKEKSFGKHAELKIVEIPEGTDWEIDEYDGMESVHEVHKSWT